VKPLLYLLLVLLTYPWWRDLLERVLREIWTAAENVEEEFPAQSRQPVTRHGPLSDHPAGRLEVVRTTPSARERRVRRERWEAGFGRRGL
jgi:hypothetical protein